jgi:PhzF family phenazine biosynthesis protein
MAGAFMSFEFFQVDAFAEAPFSGNPAMVYRLDTWLDDALMQRIAAEHNLAETAFVVKEGSAWRIRWFTPTVEVPLCGHATLATAHVLFERYGEPGDELAFVCQSGALRVLREGDRLVLDFPRLEAEEVAAPDGLSEALGCAIEDTRLGKELLVRVADEAAVRGCRPDLRRLAGMPGLGVIVTAPGERHDFVSRYFAPGIGIDEDPVTGSIHCVLAPYWAERLGRTRLSAFQCSARGGALDCEVRGERVRIGGRCVLVASGRLHLPN